MARVIRRNLELRPLCKLCGMVIDWLQMSGLCNPCEIDVTTDHLLHWLSRTERETRGEGDSE